MPRTQCAPQLRRTALADLCNVLNSLRVIAIITYNDSIVEFTQKEYEQLAESLELRLFGDVREETRQKGN